MYRLTHQIALGAILLAGLVLLGWNERAGAQAQSPGSSSSPGTTMSEPSSSMGMLPAGVTPEKLKSRDNICEAFQSLTADALTKDRFSHCCGHFVDADRDRINKSESNMSYDDLNRAIELFQQQWKSKYNKEFDPKGNDQAYSTLQITEGKIADPNQLTDWPVNPTPQTSVPKIQPGASGYNLDKGRAIAVACFPAMSNASPITCSLAHQRFGTWRFVIPNNLDAATLKANLVREINALTSASASWPSDPNEAYRIVTDHVLMAIYNVSESSSSQR
jgi:hypothetical protein